MWEKIILAISVKVSVNDLVPYSEYGNTTIIIRQVIAQEEDHLNCHYRNDISPIHSFVSHLIVLKRYNEVRGP